MLKEPELLGSLNQAQLNAVNAIHDASVQLESMITNLLDAHKIDIKELKFIKENILVDKFMGKIFINYTPVMSKKKINFVNSCNQKLSIVADSDRLTQVVSNLINNAMEFVPKENARIEIGTQDKGDKVVLYVKDNGIGIPKEKQANLFQKFYQVDCSHRRTHRGTGLGLAICKGIVEELGGNIAVESELGKGTTFLITLPSIENQTNHSLDEKNPTKSVSIMSTLME